MPSDEAGAATDEATLRDRIMSAAVPKNEQEWWAKYRIEQLEARETFQERVVDWMLKCFTPEIATDTLERNDRFIEEALELVQSLGYSADRAHALVDYVFGRDIGDPQQEVGGVMVTLAALCGPNGLDMAESAEREYQRINAPAVIEKIRAKQATKPVGSALPIPIKEQDDAE